MTKGAAYVLALGTIAAVLPGSPGGTSRITVLAGRHDRRATVVSFPLLGTTPGMYALRDAKGQTVPLQVDANGVGWFVLDDLKAGATREYTIEPGKAPPPAGVAATREGDDVRVARGGRPIFQYRGGPGVLPEADIKPAFRRGGYLHPVQTPSGTVVTDDYPPDHRHHHGVWFAWTKTEFQGRTPDFWNMGDGKAKVEFESLEDSWSGPVHAGLRARHAYVDLSGAAPVVALKESWQARAYAVGQAGRPLHLFDLELTQSPAPGAPLVLPEYHYGGLAIRGRREWDGKANASFLTSEGKDRSNGHATRARWCHLSGRTEGGVAGAAVLGHPHNFRAPEPLRIHPDNPFFCFAPSQLGRWEISAPHVARYRFVVQDGPPDPKELDRLWNDYAEPPQVTLSSR
jgi:hypothetical protein